jgi:hypothetical protein
VFRKARPSAYSPKKLEQRGGKVEQGVTFVDFVEETDFWLALEPTPASAG